VYASLGFQRLGGEYLTPGPAELPQCSPSGGHSLVTLFGVDKPCHRRPRHAPRRPRALPIPARGYWAKVEAGTHVAPPPLPHAPPGLPDKIRIKIRNPAYSGAEQSTDRPPPGLPHRDGTKSLPTSSQY
jgi:hypothetical protein